MKFGLSDSALEILYELFRNRSEIHRVILYGSRAMGNYRAGSDIDIALVTGDDFSYNELISLKIELDNSSLPYFVDVSILNRINNKNLVEHINRAGRNLYEKEPRPASGQSAGKQK
jgi:predicted nucleotidyltransferase